MDMPISTRRATTQSDGVASKGSRVALFKRKELIESLSSKCNKEQGVELTRNGKVN